jgi:hypothetical protein
VIAALNWSPSLFAYTAAGLSRPGKPLSFLARTQRLDDDPGVLDVEKFADAPVDGEPHVHPLRELRRAFDLNEPCVCQDEDGRLCDDGLLAFERDRTTTVFQDQPGQRIGLIEGQLSPRGGNAMCSDERRLPSHRTYLRSKVLPFIAHVDAPSFEFS